MERRLSQNWTCAQRKNDLILICSRSKRPADTGLEIRRVGNVAQNNSASLMDVWIEHVRGTNCTNNKHLFKTMTLWLMCWLIQSHFETWNLVTCWQAANAVEMCLYFPLIMVPPTIINLLLVTLPASAIHDKLLICQRDWWRWQNELGSVWASASAIASLKALYMYIYIYIADKQVSLSVFVQHTLLKRS